MPRIAAIIFVGGKARRLNGADKSNLMIGDKSCLDRLLDIFSGRVECTALSVGHRDRYDHGKSHPLVFDWPATEIEKSGVAYAILGSLSWAKDAGYDAIITTPVDTPLLPGTYVKHLLQENNGFSPTVFRTSAGLQGLHAAWPTSCFDKVKHAILNDNFQKISTLHQILRSNEVITSEKEAFRFTNINDEDSLTAAKKFSDKFEDLNTKKSTGARPLQSSN